MPFINWLESLDKSVRYRVKERLDRMRLGNLGDFKKLTANLYELRLPFGSGYRIYFSILDDKHILLLCGSDKKTQANDILKAQSFWLDYMR